MTSAEVDVSAEVEASLDSSWGQAASQSSSESSTVTVEPGYTAVFQWVFDLDDKNTGTKVATLDTAEFAFTPSAARPPKCYPGGCKPSDSPHYQLCEPGWEI